MVNKLFKTKDKTLAETLKSRGFGYTTESDANDVFYVFPYGLNENFMNVVTENMAIFSQGQEDKVVLADVLLF